MTNPPATEPNWRSSIDPARQLPAVHPDTASRIELVCDAFARGLHQGGLAAASLVPGGYPDADDLGTGSDPYDIVKLHAQRMLADLPEDARPLGNLLLTQKSVLRWAASITAALVMRGDWIASSLVKGTIELRELLYDYASPEANSTGTEGD